MNQITNLLLLLIVTSLFLPATAIMYASGSTENNGESDSGSADDDDASDDGSMDDASDDGSMEMDDESDTWSMEKSNNALDSGSMEMDDAPDDGSMEMDDESDTWSMEKSNNALNPEPTGGTNDGLSPLTSGPTGGGTNDGLSPLTSGPTGGTNDGLSPLTSGPTPTGTNAALRVESNSTGNAYCDSCNNDIYNGGGDFASMILAGHNRERAAVSVPPLVWSDKLAADAQIWADHLAATGEFAHDLDRGPVGENLAERGHCAFTWSNGTCHKTDVPPAQMQQGWIAEKNSYQGLPSATGTTVVGHYTQMVWRDTTSVGCASATGADPLLGYPDRLVCRYSPSGNTGGPPY